ncbi:glycosyltransferase [Gayadomonas joobiniege]|uniref:glycosyltransferase n=1 Tax=Gayadomonas joobiniege TaxID=1234606 RepID=UPI0003738BC7|nr:glycosyltransferase [Gayadomonas joobiniege]
MKKVLFIAYLFPPIANSGTQRSVKFANNLLQHNWQPYVLTVKNPPDPSIDPALLNEVDKHVPVYRVPMQSEKMCSQLTSWLPKPLKNKIKSGLEWRLRSLQQTPDEYVGWVPTALQAAIRLHKEQHFDLVYVTGMPWSSFLIADKLKQKTGLPMVLDYRDLWNNTDLGWESQTVNKHNTALENKLLDNADAVISTTDSFVDKLMLDQQVPAHKKDRFYCITNGYEPDEFLAAKQLAPILDSSTFNIVYTGVWKDGYNISRLLEAISYLLKQHPELKIKLYTAGYQDKQANRFDLENNMVEFGRVAHKQALKMMLEADLLYLPIPEGKVGHMQLPGKLFEYVGSGSTILADLPSDSEAGKMLAKTGGADIGQSTSIEGLADRLMSHYHKTANVQPANAKACRQLERQAQAAQLAAVFNRLVSDRRQ